MAKMFPIITIMHTNHKLSSSEAYDDQVDSTALPFKWKCGIIPLITGLEAVLNTHRSDCNTAGMGIMDIVFFHITI